MRDVVHNSSAEALATAIEANAIELYATMRHCSPADLHRAPDLTRFSSGLPVWRFNVVFDARLETDTTDVRIEEMLEHFRPLGVPMAWIVTPSSRPVSLGERLIAHGLTLAAEPAGMAADLFKLDEYLAPPPGLVIERVGSLATFRAWMHPFAVGLECPASAIDALSELVFSWFSGVGLGVDSPLRHYVGLQHGEPVASSSLFLAAGVAGVYNVDTIPEARRQGIGTALTLAPLREARELGYCAGVLHASAMGYPVYRRIGFREFCRAALYQGPGEGRPSISPSART